MANIDAPRGLVPVGTQDGSPWNGATNKYYLYTAATNLFIGDPIMKGATADAAGVPGVNIAAAGAVTLGALTSLVFCPASPTRKYYTGAATGVYGNVCDAGDVVFECQEDSDGNFIVALDAGYNINLVSGTGNSTTGTSAWEVNSDTADTTSTLQMHLLRPVDRPDNAIGNHCDWLVSHNNWQGANQITGV